MPCRDMDTWVLTWACFNGTICIPQIVAAICGGAVLSLVGSHQSDMMIVAGILLICRCFVCLHFIKGKIRNK